MEKSSGKKQTATVVVGVLAVAWLALEIVFKPLLNKLNSSSKDKPDSDEATAAPPASDDAEAAPPAAEEAEAPPATEEA